MMRTWSWLLISAAGAWLGLSGRAAAQECETNEDCVESYTCEVVGASGCGFACADDGDGDGECEPPPDFECEETEYKACVPGPCSADADCADGMVCIESESFDCPVTSEVDCPPGAECPKPEPVECEPTKGSMCVPRYTVPCTEDADCGDGFDCVEDIAYGCSGSAPAGMPSDGGGSEPGAGGDDPGAGDPEPAPAPPPEESCTEEALGTFHCEAREVECEADADCPTDWTCGENYARPVCGGTMTDQTEPAPTAAACPDAIPETCRLCDSGDCGEPVCVDGGWSFVCPEDEANDDEDPAEAPRPGTPDDCGIDPTTPERICQPPYYDLGWGGIATADGVAANSSGMAGGATEAEPQAPGASPAPRDDAAEEAGDGDEVSFGSGETAMDPKADSGCAVSAPGADRGSLAGLFGALGLGLLGLRRRRG